MSVGIPGAVCGLHGGGGHSPAVPTPSGVFLVRHRGCQANVESLCPWQNNFLPEKQDVKKKHHVLLSFISVLFFFFFFNLNLYFMFNCLSLLSPVDAQHWIRLSIRGWVAQWDRFRFRIRFRFCKRSFSFVVFFLLRMAKFVIRKALARQFV